MATQVSEYKCPSCTGPLRFDARTGKLTCDYCGSSFTVAEIEALYQEKDKASLSAKSGRDAASMQDASGGDTDGYSAYTCSSCGAELIYDVSTAASSCPYCGNNTIVPKQLDGEFKPDYIIPFKLEKADAMKVLEKHFKTKPLIPDAFVKDHHIEDIKGVYVPFWLYDGHAEGSADFTGEIVHSHREGEFEVTVTEEYALHREGRASFEKIPADASKAMPDDYMDSVEPYDYNELKPFSRGYLPGFIAERWDVSEEECAPRAERRTKATIVSALQSSCGDYTSVRSSGEARISSDREKAHYALLPVWVLTTKWNDQLYMLTMNGQTGKMVGVLPSDKGKFWRKTLVCFAAVCAAVTVTLSFLFMM